MSSSGPTYLREGELLELHSRVISLYGGVAGVRDHPALASCLAQPQMAVFGRERFPSLEAKAAAYCFFIVRNHPFVDGNKRAGFLAALHFLLVNGVVPRFDEASTHDAITAVAEGHLDVDGLTEFFRTAIVG